MSSSTRLCLEICAFLFLGMVAVVAGVLVMIASGTVLLAATTLGSSLSLQRPSFPRRKKRTPTKPIRSPHPNDHIIDELEQQFRDAPPDLSTREG